MDKVKNMVKKAKHCIGYTISQPFAYSSINKIKINKVEFNRTEMRKGVWITTILLKDRMNRSWGFQNQIWVFDPPKYIQDIKKKLEKIRG